MSIMEDGIPVAVPEKSYDSVSRGIKTAGFTVSMEYTNYTKSDLYIKTQNNIAIVVSPNVNTISPGSPFPHLEVKITYTLVNNNTISETMLLLRSFSQNNIMLSKDAQFMLDRLSTIYSQDPSMRNKSNISLSIVQRVTEDAIRSKKLLYYKECDIVITFDKGAVSLPHPKSDEGLQSIEFGSGPSYSGQAGVFVKVVDNDHIAAVRYYYGGRRLISVPSIVDDTKKSGVYCTYATMKGDGFVEPESSFLTFEEAEEVIGLFKNKEDAMTNGDPDQLLRLEEARSRSEEKRLGLELQQLKHESSVMAVRAEQELTELRRALELSKAETVQFKEAADVRKLVRDDRFDLSKRARDEDYSRRELDRKDYYDHRDRGRKAYYEERSLERKDSSEFIKFIPALLLGVAGTFAWMRSNNS